LGNYAFSNYCPDEIAVRIFREDSAGMIVKQGNDAYANAPNNRVFNVDVALPHRFTPFLLTLKSGSKGVTS
jgi:hypothetical protein